MNYNIILDKKDVSRISTMLQRFPEDWKKDRVSMAIARKASKPMLDVGKQFLSMSVPNLGSDSSIEFKAKLDRTKTILRVGLVNKGKGRLGHLFNFGTSDRTNYTSGRFVGRIDSAKFGSGWWDKAVNVAMPMVERQLDIVAPSIITRQFKKYNT